MPNPEWRSPAAAWRRLRGLLVDGPTVVVMVPLIGAAVRAMASGWIPVGENAVISIRAADVLTSNHPWVGTASSVSVSSGASANHPGPMLFDLLALPVRVLGARWGLILGLLVLQTIAAQVAVAALRRAGGRAGAWCAAAGVVGLCWTLGPELVLDPWNPHVLLLPLLAALCAATAVAAGHSAYLAWLVAFGSLVLQTHVSTLLLVPVVVAVALGALWRTREARGRHLWTALAVALLCWVQPVWQQLFGAGPGNLGALATSGDGGPRVGPVLGARLAAEVLVLPPWWLRPSFERSLLDLPLRDAEGAAMPTPAWVGGAPLAVLALVAAIAMLVLLARVARRRGARGPAAACVLAAAGIVASVASAALIPAEGYGVAPHQLRLLWPVAVWWTAAAAWTAWVCWAARRWSPHVVRRARLGAGGGVLALAVWTLPSYSQAVGVARATPSIADVRRITEQVAHAHVPPVLLAEGALWIGEPYTIPVLQALWEHDQPVYVDATGAVQFGGERFADQPLDAVLYLRAGAAALSCADGAVRLALVSPLSPAERDAFDAVQRAVLEAVGAASSRPADRALLDQVARGEAEQVLLAAGAQVDAGIAALIEEYEALRTGPGVSTVAVFATAADGTDAPAAEGVREASCPGLR